jgi:nucleotide-binding universal stress UspA family protein
VPQRVTSIVVAVDFSRNAPVALETAVDLAQLHQAGLTAVYAIPQAIFQPEWATEMEDTLDIADITENAQRALANMTGPYRQRGIDITEEILCGVPYVGIVRLAQRLHADLIVIGAHGSSGQEPLRMGSVAEKMVRQAPCSVLTVRASH